MKLLQKSQYKNLEVAEQFNSIIKNKLDGYDGSKKDKLKSFFEDLQKGGCQSGMIGDFIYTKASSRDYLSAGLSTQVCVRP